MVPPHRRAGRSSRWRGEAEGGGVTASADASSRSSAVDRPGGRRVAFATLVIPAFSGLFMQLVVMRRLLSRGRVTEGVVPLRRLDWLCHAVMPLFTVLRIAGGVDRANVTSGKFRVIKSSTRDVAMLGSAV